MNPIHQCIQKISSGNHFRTYGTYVHTDKGDAICPPPPHYKWRGHKNNRDNNRSRKTYPVCKEFKVFAHLGLAHMVACLYHYKCMVSDYDKCYKILNTSCLPNRVDPDLKKQSDLGLAFLTSIL